MMAFLQTVFIILNFLILYCTLNFVIKIKSLNISVLIIFFIYSLISSIFESLDHVEGIHNQLT